MVISYTVAVKCTNNLCDYTGTTTLVNESHLKEKRVCPKCGFKTLDEEPARLGAESAAALAEALYGSGGREYHD